ncbi:MAG: class I SAM-dependent methyltransferase [Bacteroidota bacterium]
MDNSIPISQDDLPKPDYGIDAPQIVKRFFISGALAIALGAVLLVVFRESNPGVSHYGGAAGFITGIMYLGSAGLMLWGSRYHKLRMRDKLLLKLDLHGDEKVLDIGCGQGLLTVPIAAELIDGMVTGIDFIQNGFKPEESFKNLLKNAQYEGAESKIVLKSVDPRQLPFPSDSFDVIVSGWALHTIYDEAGRKHAVKEIIRVLKPGGILAILDNHNTDEYEDMCHDADLHEIHQTRGGFMRIIPTRLLTAKKPL